MEYVILAILWVGWCALHSVLASIRINSYLKSRFSEIYRYYRFTYNAIAVVTLIPVLAYSFHIQGPVFLEWDGYWLGLQALMVSVGALLFFAPLKQYDMSRFFGWQQIKDGLTHEVLSKDNKLDTSGVLACIRHPWYSGAILLIWARNLDMATIIVNVIITAYFMIGAMLEERKLVLELGDEYRRYQQTVGMFIPYRCVARIFKH